MQENFYPLHNDATLTLPSVWASQVEACLTNEETVLAWLEIDLDTQLHFSSGIVVVTNRRLIAKMAKEESWHDWKYQQGLVLACRDYAGVGNLELFDAHARLAHWCYTLSKGARASRLIAQFTQLLNAGLTRETQIQPIAAKCPKCGAALINDQETCPVCDQDVHAAPSTWTLFRLWRFARAL